MNEQIMKITGTDWGGNDNPPEARTLRLSDDGKGREVDGSAREYRVIASGNDGHELWIGWSHEWDTHLHSREVRALTKWLIVDWYIKARWLGLRRPIYYWALRRHVRGLKRRAS